jgi:hypothetical protein
VEKDRFVFCNDFSTIGAPLINHLRQFLYMYSSPNLYPESYIIMRMVGVIYTFMAVFSSIYCIVWISDHLRSQLLIQCSSTYRSWFPRYNNHHHLIQYVGWDRAVLIVTCYGLEGLGIESWWGWDFLHLSRLALAPTQPPIQLVPGYSRGKTVVFMFCIRS